METHPTPRAKLDITEDAGALAAQQKTDVRVASINGATKVENTNVNTTILTFQA